MKPHFRFLAIFLVLLSVFSLASCSLLGLNQTPTAVSDFIEDADQPINSDQITDTDQIPYTITYDLGDGRITTVVYHSTDPDYVPEEPVRAGYRFLWWTADGDNGHYNGVVQSGSSGNISFRAVWELVTYTLTYQNADGTSNPSTYTVESDSFTLKSPQKAGYTFLGWHAQDGQLKKEMVVPKGSYGDLVFTAEWSATPYAFSVSANIDAPITVSFGEKYLETDTPIRVTAPMYVDDKMFSCWKIGETTVSDTVIYTFPMPGKNTELQAIYTDLITVSYDKASGAAQSILLDFQPTHFFGGNAETGTDVTLNENGLIFSKSYLASLDPGDYRFWAATIQAEIEENKKAEYTVSDEVTFTLRVTDSANTPKTDPTYANLTETAKDFYNKPTFSYQGRTYHRVVSTEAEFRAMIEYFTFVGGVLQMQLENNRSKEYTFDFYLIGDFDTFSAHILEISFPMHPKISFQRRFSDPGMIVTYSVQYRDGLNDEVSSQERNPIGDRQKLLTSKGRPDDYNSFKIDALTKTADVRTIYELEVLPCGMKPIFADSASDAKAVYEKARSILRKIIDDSMDDYAKVAAIYAWLAENLTYDTVAVTSPAALYASYTIKGALIDRISVCDGYASAFRLLCQIEGIRAEEVTGFCDQQGSLGGHAWNKVWIGGAVYGVDSTWARIVVLRKDTTKSYFVTTQHLFISEKDLFLQNHYENPNQNANRQNITPRVVTLADANIFLPKTVVLGSSKYDFCIDSKEEFYAMVEYLRKNDIVAAEFYNNSSEEFSSGFSSYTVYSSSASKYCYIELSQII